jgi:hypothetical protein
MPYTLPHTACRIFAKSLRNSCDRPLCATNDGALYTGAATISITAASGSHHRIGKPDHAMTAYSDDHTSSPWSAFNLGVRAKEAPG